MPIICIDSVKLQVILKSDVLFPPNLKDSVTIHQKSFLIFKFLCKYVVCYISLTTQRLEVRMNQHIPSTICTNKLDCSALSSNQNSSSIIAQHLLDNPVCAAAYNPAMFIILENLTSYIHLCSRPSSLQNSYLHCTYKRNFTHYFYLILNSTKPNFVCEENNITCTTSSGLQWTFFSLSYLCSLPHQYAFWWSIPHVCFLITTCLSWKFFSDET